MNVRLALSGSSNLDAALGGSSTYEEDAKASLAGNGDNDRDTEEAAGHDCQGPVYENFSQFHRYLLLTDMRARAKVIL